LYHLHIKKPQYILYQTIQYHGSQYYSIKFHHHVNLIVIVMYYPNHTIMMMIIFTKFELNRDNLCCTVILHAVNLHLQHVSSGDKEFNIYQSCFILFNSASSLTSWLSTCFFKFKYLKTQVKK
jgi:hypothetical protein